jgi:hypothetical protein
MAADHRGLLARRALPIFAFAKPRRIDTVARDCLWFSPCFGHGFTLDGIFVYAVPAERPDPERRVANCVGRDTSSGWRIEKAHSRAQNDGVMALLMALERVEQPAEPVQLLGWL